MAIQYDHDHENEINFFAMTNFRNQQRKFGIKTDDRRRHMYLIGKTGMGKTTALENLILNDIIAGHGVGVVDPHGDMADKLLDYIPQNRINDVVYFNPADADFPMAFNVLETVNPLHKHLVAQGLMGVFKKIWPDVWSARMEHILNNCILALLDYPGSTLLGINRLLVDKNFRKRVVTKIKDPIVKAFWVDEYQVWEARFRNEAIQPIQNKVGQFLSASVIRNIVAQVKSTINPREFMDNGKIFIMNLAKGRLGEDTSRLLGGMLITKLQLAAMERVDTPEPDRRDFYLYVDEFQNFATESFANILSEARKYRLNLIVAHQYIGQLITDVSTKVRDAVFGNVGTMVLFRIGAEDAEFVAKEFSPHFIEEDMVNLTKYDVYLKLMIDGVTSNPFSATTLPPVAQFQGNRDKIIRVSRERYAAEVAVIEEKVMRWSGMEEEGEGVEGDGLSEPRGTRSGEFGGMNDSNTHPRSSSTRPRVSLGAPTQAGLRVSSAGSGQPSPAQGVEIGGGVPIVKAGLEIKPISLSEALRQRPVQIKAGSPQVHPRPTGLIQSPSAPTLPQSSALVHSGASNLPGSGLSQSAKKRRRRRRIRQERQEGGVGPQFGQVSAPTPPPVPTPNSSPEIKPESDNTDLKFE